MQQLNGEIVAGLTGLAPALLTVTLEAASTNRTRIKRIFIGNLHTAKCGHRLNLSCLCDPAPSVAEATVPTKCFDYELANEPSHRLDDCLLDEGGI